MRECKAEEVSADQMEIRRLRHELDGLTSAGVVECMARNPAVFERISDLERDLAAAQEARQAAEARAESYKATIDRARRVMGGEGVEDQGQAWDQCLRILDAAIDAARTP